MSEKLIKPGDVLKLRLGQYESLTIDVAEKGIIVRTEVSRIGVMPQAGNSIAVTTVEFNRVQDGDTHDTGTKRRRRPRSSKR